MTREPGVGQRAWRSSRGVVPAVRRRRRSELLQERTRASFIRGRRGLIDKGKGCLLRSVNCSCPRQTWAMISCRNLQLKDLGPHALGTNIAWEVGNNNLRLSTKISEGGRHEYDECWSRE